MVDLHSENQDPQISILESKFSKVGGVCLNLHFNNNLSDYTFLNWRSDYENTWISDFAMILLLLLCHPTVHFQT